MRCFGRNRDFSRCRNNAQFLFCRRHRIQFVFLLFIILPAAFADYSSIVNFFYKEKPNVAIDKAEKWLTPFSSQHINILVADFIDQGGNVSEESRHWTAKIFNELDRFLKLDPSLTEIVDLRRLYSDLYKIVIRDEIKARYIADSLNANIFIWGQNLCMGDSVCYYSKTLFKHQTRQISQISSGIIQKTEILNLELPTLVGSNTNMLLNYIIGWTYLEDYKHMNFDKAIYYLEEALNQASPDERANLLFFCAEALQNASRFDQALNFYHELLSQEGNDIDNNTLSKVQYHIGEIYKKKGQTEEAIDWFTKALSTMDSIKDSLRMVEPYNSLAGIYATRGEVEKALNYLYKNESIAKHFEDATKLAWTYNHLGLIFADLDEWQKSLFYHRKSMEIEIEKGNSAGLASLYNNIGIVYLSINELDSALYFFNEAISLYKKTGVQLEMGAALNNIGLIYARQRNWDKALAYHEDAQEIFNSIGAMAALGKSYYNVALIYTNKNQDSTAMNFLRKAIPILEVAQDKWELTKIYAQAGYVFTRDALYDSGPVYYQAALECADKLGWEEYIGKVCNDIGYIHKRTKIFAESLKYLWRSMKVNKRVEGNISTLGNTYYHIADIYYQTRTLDSALILHRKLYQNSEIT